MSSTYIVQNAPDSINNGDGDDDDDDDQDNNENCNHYFYYYYYYNCPISQPTESIISIILIYNLQNKWIHYYNNNI